MDFLVGLILIATGVAVIKFRYPLYHFTGDWDWAMRFLGSGGTVAAIAIIGAGLIFVGVAFPLGAFDDTRSAGNNTGSGSVVESKISPFNK